MKIKYTQIFMSRVTDNNKKIKLIIVYNNQSMQASFQHNNKIY